MEPIVVYSKNDITEIWEKLRESFSSKEVIFYQKSNASYLKILPKAKKRFRTILAKWLNRKYCQIQLQNTLVRCTENLSEHDILGIRRLALQKLEIEKDVLIQILCENFNNMEEVSNLINLDGFMTFGMQDYYEEIEEFIQECIDEYMSGEEYREFLNLLHDFVDLETPQLKNLIIKTDQDGCYRFYDEEHSEITELCTNVFQTEFSNQIQEEKEYQNDMLISVLVVMVPENIYLHGSRYIENKNFLVTLQAIFADRLRIYEE